MTMSTESLSDGQPSRKERYGQARASSYRGSVADGGESRNGSSVVPGLESAGADKPRLPSLDPAAPSEPVFAASSWLDADASEVAETGSLADHPLLRGLLLELPPKGSTPPPDWLDRWFEATRSILELLYGR